MKDLATNMTKDSSPKVRQGSMNEEKLFGIIILILMLAGLVINLICLYRLRRHHSVFHKFLKMLAVFDTLVVGFCAWLYSFPTISQGFNKNVFLPSVPYTLPIVHMALMGSVYSTIVMSLERYLRLCKLQAMSQKTFLICTFVVIAFPIIFYMPKFFEYKYEKFVQKVTRKINCSSFAKEQEELADLAKAVDWEPVSFGDDILVRSAARRSPDPKSRGSFLAAHQSRPKHFPKECLEFAFPPLENETYIRQIEETVVYYYPNSTALRRDPLFYNVYCVGLNTLFATALPLLALLFFNVATLLALRRLSKSNASTSDCGSHLEREFQPRRLTSSSKGGTNNVRFGTIQIEMKELKNTPEPTTRPRKHPPVNNHQGNKPNLKSERQVLMLHNFVGNNVDDQGRSGNTRLVPIETNEGDMEANANLARRDSFVNNYHTMRRKKENRLTRISISIVWLFIFCHVWKLIPTIYELVVSEGNPEHINWPAWLVTIKHLSHTLIAFNSAVNFLIYAIL